MVSTTLICPYQQPDVVGKNGAVEYAFVDADYTTRAEPVEILHILEELSGEH